MLLCSPHNPVGKVFTREELVRIGEICSRHQVILFADEIHGDFVYAGSRHIPAASVIPRLPDGRGAQQGLQSGRYEGCGGDRAGRRAG